MPGPTAAPSRPSPRPGGSSLQAFACTLGTWVHAGLDPATPNRNLQTPFGPYGYDPGIAADAAGRAYVARYSSAAAAVACPRGRWAPTAPPWGGALTMPNTAGMRFGVTGRTPIAARARRRRARRPRHRPAAQQHPPVARRRGRVRHRDRPGPARLEGDARGGARRPPVARTVFGAAVVAGAPARAATAYHLDGSVAGGAPDVVGSFSLGTSSCAATYTRRVLSGLTIVASPGRIARGTTATVRFRVLDAGDPVRGARVRVGRALGVADPSGTVRLSLTGAGAALSARATAPGYTAGVTAVRVTRQPPTSVLVVPVVLEGQARVGLPLLDDAPGVAPVHLRAGSLQHGQRQRLGARRRWPLQLGEHRPHNVLAQPGPLRQDVLGGLAQVEVVAAHRSGAGGPCTARSWVSGVTPSSRSSTLRTRSVGVFGSASITRRKRGTAK